MRYFLLMFFFGTAALAQDDRNADFEPAFANQTRAPAGERVKLQVETIVTGLERPWGIAVLPGGSLLITERPGRLVLLEQGKAPRHVAGVPKVRDSGQGGMLDVAIAPDFATSRIIYLTYAKPVLGARGATAAARARLSDDGSRLEGLQDIFVQDPAMRGGRHFGSRIVIDGNYLFITTGDRGSEGTSQALDRTQGKVVRLHLDGSVPRDNPFVGQDGVLPEIWTYGHRNPQGAALHPDTGELWTLEHGPAGGDELNRIERGANYGWPIVSYGVNYSGSAVGSGQARAPGIEEPVYYWDPVIAPGGFAFYQGDLFDWRGDVLAGSLNPGGLVHLKMRNGLVVAETRYFVGEARVRDIEVLPDGSILLVRDDGRVLRLTPG